MIWIQGFTGNTPTDEEWDDRRRSCRVQLTTSGPATFCVQDSTKPFGCSFFLVSLDPHKNLRSVRSCTSPMTRGIFSAFLICNIKSSKEPKEFLRMFGTLVGRDCPSNSLRLAGVTWSSNVAVTSFACQEVLMRTSQRGPQQGDVLDVLDTIQNI